MGRQVKIRANYREDAIFLRRLADAIEKDPKVSDEFKSDAIAKIDQLISLFLQPNEKAAATG